jgi:hypothetical protein
VGEAVCEATLIGRGLLDSAELGIVVVNLLPAIEAQRLDLAVPFRDESCVTSTPANLTVPWPAKERSAMSIGRCAKRFVYAARKLSIVTARGATRR